MDNRKITHFVLITWPPPNTDTNCLAVHETRIRVLLAEAIRSNFIYEHIQFLQFLGVFALTGNGRRGPILTKLGGRVEESLLNLME